VIATQPTTPPDDVKDIPALTSLRFLAAAMVFLFHFQPANASWPLAVLAGQGHVGVTVFFVLSGFLITIRYSNGLGRPDGVALGEYFRKRVARIVPLYWAVLGISLALSVGGLEFSWRTLPEWALLQGFLSRSIDDLAVPTSWTLTLEETFYLTAPVLFVIVRPARAFGAWVLLACAAVLLCGGFALGQLVDPERFQFLGSAQELLRHTFFGRFGDFALGVWGGRLFLSGRVGELWARPRGHLVATAAGVAGIGMVFAGEAGMTWAGGFDSPSWPTAWAFNTVVGAGSLVLILSLTSARSPLSRILGVAPLVYLGRVSYAMYLIQLTPLGKGLLYRLIPSGTPGYVLLLYAGMTAVSALLYELVEEPGRRLVLRVWPGSKQRSRRDEAGDGRQSRIRSAWPLVVVVAVAAFLQTAAWAGHAAIQQRPPTLAESQWAASALPDRIMSSPANHLQVRLVPEGRWHRLPIPETWMIGTTSDRRAPPSLLVYADGQPIPFERRASGGDVAPARAHLRGPRAKFVELVMPDDAMPSEITLVRHDPPLALRLLVRRIGGTPPLLAMIGFAAGAAVGVARLASRSWRPTFRSASALAMAACAVFILSEAHLEPWAPAVIAVEMLGLHVIAGLRRPARMRSAA
jgi:peptidoglycan/LPS O-acetylase OafA/YrhL